MTTYIQIQEEIKRLQAEAEKVRAHELKAIVQELKEKIQYYGLSAKDLGLHKASSSAKKLSGEPAVVMYRHSDGRTWSGHGRKPFWIVEVIQNGGDINQYRV